METMNLKQKVRDCLSGHITGIWHCLASLCSASFLFVASEAVFILDFPPPSMQAVSTWLSIVSFHILRRLECPKAAFWAQFCSSSE